MNNDEKMFDAACELYGDCVGSKYCLENVKKELMLIFGLSEDAAEELALKAFNEWVEAYS